MKELIKEIKARISYQELKIQDLNDYTKENGNLKNILNAEIKAKKEHLNDLKILLKNIQEKEEKPFNPLELGFELSIRCLDHLVWTNLNCLEFILLKGNYKYYLRLLKKESQIWIFREDITYDDASKTILEPIFIPSHRFGVELLQNLRVIE